jgi:hypothetical protein
MNAKDAILKIRALFEDMPVEPVAEEKPAEEVKVEMAEYSLMDGTKVMISSLEVGGDVTFEDGTIVPDAEHELADGMKIVTVEGKITEVKPKEEEIEVEIESTKIEEMVSEFNSIFSTLIAENVKLNDKIKDIEFKNKQGFEMVVAMFEEFSKIPNADPIDKPASFKFEQTKDIKFERLNKYRNAILNNKN